MVYYSGLSYAQASPQMAQTQERPIKPEELVLLDDLTGLRMSFLDGGYIDQPWLLVNILAAAAQAREMSHVVTQAVTTPSSDE